MTPVIKIICENTGSEIAVNLGTSLLDVVKMIQLDGQNPVLAAYVNNRIKELNYKKLLL